MILLKSVLLLYLLFLSFTNVFSQTTSSYTAYQQSFPYVTTCGVNEYYDIALLQCSPCPANAIQKPNSNTIHIYFFSTCNYLDITQCECTNSTFYYGVNQGGGSLLCLQCNGGYVCQ